MRLPWIRGVTESRDKRDQRQELTMSTIWWFYDSFADLRGCHWPHSRTGVITLRAARLILLVVSSSRLLAGFIRVGTGLM